MSACRERVKVDRCVSACRERVKVDSVCQLVERE